MGFPLSPPHNAGDDALNRPLQDYIVCCTSIPPEERVRPAAARKMEINSDFLVSGYVGRSCLMCRTNGSNP